MIKQAQIKQTQSRSGISQPSNIPNEPSKGGFAPKTTQDPRMVSAPSKDAESSTAKALSLSLAPSVAMTLGSGTIPPNVLTPPSNEQKALLSQPQVPFARQVCIKLMEQIFVVKHLFSKNSSQRKTHKLFSFLLDILKLRCWRQ